MLSDDILNNPILDRVFETAEEFENIKHYVIEAGIGYPEKVEFEPQKETVYICYDPYEELFYLKNQNVNNVSLVEIYDDLSKQDVNIQFDESVKKSDWVDQKDLNNLVFTRKDTRPGFGRILIPTDQSQSLEYATYLGFLKNAKTWLAEPDNFVAAYYFTKGHPAFWYRPQPEKRPYDWETEDGHHGLYIYVSSEGIGIEHGQSVPPQHSYHYHDHHLDVFEPTFELAHIAFAKKVHEHFYLDGTERPDNCTFTKE